MEPLLPANQFLNLKAGTESSPSLRCRPPVAAVDGRGRARNDAVVGPNRTDVEHGVEVGALRAVRVKQSSVARTRTVGARSSVDSSTLPEVTRPAPR